jgi:hypothetical protein
MSEYDILLKPTKIKDRWCDVPRITTCGVNKEIVKTWKDVVDCAKELGYKCSPEDKFVYKRVGGPFLFTFTETYDFLINNNSIRKLEYNKMVLYMLLFENKL